MEAFVDIGAACGFANGVKIQRTQAGFQLVERLEMSGAFARPFRQARTSGCNLNEHLLSDYGFESSGFQTGFGLSKRGQVGERTDQHAKEFGLGAFTQ